MASLPSRCSYESTRDSPFSISASVFAHRLLPLFLSCTTYLFNTSWFHSTITLRDAALPSRLFVSFLHHRCCNTWFSFLQHVCQGKGTIINGRVHSVNVRPTTIHHDHGSHRATPESSRALTATSAAESRPDTLNLDTGTRTSSRNPCLGLRLG